MLINLNDASQSLLCSIYMLACLSLSVFLPACLFSLSLLLSTSLHLSFSLCCGSASLCLCVCCLCLCLSVSRSLSLYLSLSLSLSIYILSLSYCLCPCLSVPLHLSCCALPVCPFIKNTNIQIQLCGLHCILCKVFCAAQIMVFVECISHTNAKCVSLLMI